MAVEQPNVTIEITEATDCSGISLLDTTGLYNSVTNPEGYGLPDGPAVNDVTEVKIRVTMNALGEAYFEYVITLVAGEVDEVTLSINGSTPEVISTDQATWPFTTDFNLFGDYGVTLPTYQDDVYKVDYTISGEVGADAFEYLVTKYHASDCVVRCCLERKFADLDPGCDCSSPKVETLLKAEATRKTFLYAGQYGRMTPALRALTELQNFCNSECGGCGC